MSKFIYIYKGPGMNMDQITQEQAAEQTAAWGAWMGKVGAALVDGGAPFAPGTSVVDDGSTAAPSPLTGYTVVEAPDLDAAKALTAGHPFLTDGKGTFSIDIFELVPLQM